MNVFLDIETVPYADKKPFTAAARENFKAPSSLTKDEAGKDLGLAADEIKFTGKPELIARWEREMAEKMAPQVADEAWRKTALDGSQGRVISIAWQAGGQQATHIDNPDNERKNIENFIEALSSVLNERGKGRPPFFIGHNVIFDLKFLFRRCVILGIQPPFEFPFRGRHGSDYYCTMQAWCEFGERISLDNLCAALGMPGKGDMDGSKVCDYWLEGRYSEIATYNMQDLEKVVAIHQAQTFSQVAA